MRESSGFLRARAVLASALAFLLAACASVDRNPNVVSPYSDKLSPYNYKEEGIVARMVVGVEGARFIRDEHYFPLFVQLVNRAKITFNITRESFTLEDPLGNQYSMAPARELTENYPRLELDRRLFRDNRQFTAAGASLYTYIQSAFYPVAGPRSLLIDRVTLPPQAYMEDALYFPVPQSGLNGVPLRLLFRVSGLDDPIQVVFEVPRTLGILEKKKDKDRP